MNEKQFRNWLLVKLRRVSRFWPVKTQVYHRVKVDKGIYECESCKKHFKQKDLQLDHIDPVIDPKVGFVDWNTYINRLFCDVSNFQALCKACHKIKTAGEAKIRHSVKRKRKK